MALREPRFKNEFASSQQYALRTDEHAIVLSRNGSLLVSEAIQNCVRTFHSDMAFPQSFGWLDGTGSVEGVFTPQPDFHAEGGWLAFSFKYLEQEFKPKRQEDYLFLARLIYAAGYANPRFEATQIRHYILNNLPNLDFQLKLGIEFYLRTLNLTSDNGDWMGHPLLRIPKLKSPLDLEMNIYTGGVDVSYANLGRLSQEYHYQFLYLYLYRLYDLTVNFQQPLYQTIVLSDLAAMFDPARFKSFYVDEAEQDARRQRLLNLLNELLAHARTYNLNFIICGPVPPEIKVPSPAVIETEVPNFVIQTGL